MNKEKLNATLRFLELDLTHPASERGPFAFQRAKKESRDGLQLRDFRTAADVVKGRKGLDVQGFTYITHRSALSEDQWITGQNVEQIYIPEVEYLIGNVTGAKRAVVYNVIFRRKVADDGRKVYLKKMDKDIARLPKDTTTGTYMDRIFPKPSIGGLDPGTDKIRVLGKDREESLPPAGFAHIDYTLRGLKDSVRYCNKFTKAAGQEALDAEDSGGCAPRYAAYSVWVRLCTFTAIELQSRH